MIKKKKKINFNHAQAYVLQAYELIMFVLKRQSQVVVVETNVDSSSLQSEHIVDSRFFSFFLSFSFFFFFFFTLFVLKIYT